MCEIKRDDIDVYFMKMAFLISERATCVRRKVGAVIVRKKVVLSTGYNGAPKGINHCTAGTCIRKKLNVPSGEKSELCIGAHSEMNAISQAAMMGTRIDEATIYCTTKPCIYCAKAIVNAGIERLVYCEDYGSNENNLTDEILSNMDITKINKTELM